MFLNLTATISALPLLAATSMCANLPSTDTPTPTDPPKTVVELAAGNEDFRALVACVKACGLVETLSGNGPFTVFAPSNSAFDALGAATLAELLASEDKKALTDILKLHVVAGELTSHDVAKADSIETLGGRIKVERRDGELWIGGGRVVATDLKAGNGIVHVLKGVILPPREPDLVDLAESNKDFSTLLAAVRAAGLEKTLRGDGPFTIFAPTDAAFAKLPKGTVKTLLMPSNRDKLVAILKLHVVPQRLDASQLLHAGSAKTLAGASFDVQRDDHGVSFGPARVTTANAGARNGIVHVIDRVLTSANADR